MKVQMEIRLVPDDYQSFNYRTCLRWFKSVLVYCFKKIQMYQGLFSVTRCRNGTIQKFIFLGRLLYSRFVILRHLLYSHFARWLGWCWREQRSSKARPTRSGSPAHQRAAASSGGQGCLSSNCQQIFTPGATNYQLCIVFQLNPYLWLPKSSR